MISLGKLHYGNCKQSVMDAHEEILNLRSQHDLHKVLMGENNERCRKLNIIIGDCGTKIIGLEKENELLKEGCKDHFTIEQLMVKDGGGWILNSKDMIATKPDESFLTLNSRVESLCPEAELASGLIVNPEVAKVWVARTNDDYVVAPVPQMLKDDFNFKHTPLEHGEDELEWAPIHKDQNGVMYPGKSKKKRGKHGNN